MSTTPSSLGFHMPAEWHAHEATWLAWPHERSDWPGKFAPIRWVFADFIRNLTRCERVHLLVNNGYEEGGATRVLRRAGVDLTRVHFHLAPTDRVWVRDSGAIFVTDGKGELAALDWHFNAWAKYDNWHRDDAIPAQAAAALGVRAWQPTHHGRRVVLEGGSIDVNGEGMLLTTEECLLSEQQQRNPGMTRADYERLFADHLGVTKTVWLGNGIVGDDTHGHVDDLARFVGPRTVVAVIEDDPADANYRALQDNWDRLKGTTDTAGSPLEVVRLPMPAPVWFSGQRLPASYANFYVATDRVLVPTFNDPADRLALGVLAELFPGREVVGIHSLDLVWGLGTLHCMTQQQPRVT